MRSKVKNIFKKVLNLGIPEGADVNWSQRIRILNGLALILFVFTAFNSYWGFRLHYLPIVFLNYISATCMLFTLLLNKRRKYIAAQFIFFLSLALHIGIIETILDVSAHFFLFPLFIISAFVIERKPFLYAYFIFLLFLFFVDESRFISGFFIPIETGDQKIMKIVEGTFAFIFSIITINLFRNQYAKNQKMILMQNQLLEKAVRVSKEHAELASLLLSEMNHRVKNNLQLISSLLNIQANQLEDKTAKNAIQDSVQRISSIALIHRQLYRYKNKQTAKIDIAEYTKELVPFIKRSLAADQNGIAIRLNVQNIILPVEEAVSVGLIINETVTNSIKHGLKDLEKKMISLEIHKNGEDRIHISVADNGTGIYRMGEGKNAGFGYELIQTLVKSYKGSMIIDEEKNKITIELGCGIQPETSKQVKELATS